MSKSPLDVFLNCGGFNAHQLRYLGMGPPGTVRQEHRDALAFGQRRKSGNKARFEQWLRERRSLEEHRSLATSGSALTDPVEVAREIVDSAQTIPVLPGICQGFGCRLSSALVTVGCYQGASKAWLGLCHEDPKCRLVVFSDQGHPCEPSGCFCPHT